MRPIRLKVTQPKQRSRRTGPKESEIQRAIIQYLRIRNIACWRMNVIGIPTEKGMRPNKEMRGVADIHAIIPSAGLGLAVWLEVKTTKGRLTQNQKDFGKKVREAGGVYSVVRSVDEVERLVEAVMKKATVSGQSQSPQTCNKHHKDNF